MNKKKIIPRKLTTRKRRKNHILIYISCRNKKRNEIVNDEIRKAMIRINRLTDNKVSYEIVNDYYSHINSSSGTASTGS